MQKIDKKLKKGVAFLVILIVLVGFILSIEINYYIHINNALKIDYDYDGTFVGCIDVISVVYTDLFYTYSTGDGCNPYVFYKDGTKENLSKALYLKHIKIKDLERLNFSLIRSSHFDKNYSNTTVVGKIYENNLKDDYTVINITNDSNDTCLDMIDVFYSDSAYDYSFKCINENIMVYYENGKTEEIHEAFRNKHVKIKDLDKFNIPYYKLEKQVTVTAINNGVNNTGCNLKKTVIYSDDTYNYYIEHTCYTVVFSDGSKEPIEEAFKNNKISIKDLDDLNFNYTKEAK